jgi:hypothetical protein
LSQALFVLRLTVNVMRLAMLLVCGAGAVASAVACGRAATEEDCRVIFEKNVEVEMRSLEKADEATIEKKKKDLLQSFEGDLRQCVGKRITSSVLNCIKSARTSAEMSQCGRS